MPAAGKKLYSLIEIHRIAVDAFRSFHALKKAREAGVITPKLQERVMLAVTAVNKCALCSYAHTEMALKAGIAQDEVTAYARGDFPDVPPEEARAVLFAQHYADTRGRPSKEAWETLQAEYGPEKALAVLSAARVIMMGNAMGIILGSLRSRLKTGKGDPRSGVLYELAFVLTFIPLALVEALEALLEGLFRIPPIRFPKDRKRPEG